MGKFNHNYKAMQSIGITGADYMLIRTCKQPYTFITLYLAK